MTRHLHRQGTRRGQSIERVLGLLLTLLAIGVGTFYAAGLLYLVASGGRRLFAFALFPTPLAHVAGEDRMRFVLAASIFGALAWAAARGLRLLVRHVTTRPFALGWRAEAVTAVLVGVAGAAAFRHHLPRFLILLPSETHPGGGVGPELFNTTYLAVLSTLVTMPIGVGAALYMARFAKQARLVAAVRTALDTLASLPSIVYGLFGFLVLVVELRLGYSLFAGAIVLAILNLPLVVGVTEESLRAVPRELEDASSALGATALQTAFRVSLPYAWPGILSALVLAVGRVFAESAPLIMTAGTTISRASAYSLDPLRGGETLAVHLWYLSSSGLAPDRVEVAAATAAVLVVLVVVTNALAARLAGYGGATGTRLRRPPR